MSRIQDSRGEWHDISYQNPAVTKAFGVAHSYGEITRLEAVRTSRRAVLGRRLMVSCVAMIGLYFVVISVTAGVHGLVMGMLAALGVVLLVGGLWSACRVQARLARAIERHRGKLEAAGANGYVMPCVACGYALEGLSPESDGCVVCPECGAGWDVRALDEPADRDEVGVCG